MKNKILLLLIGITACSMSLFAQDRKVSGIVKGKSDQVARLAAYYEYDVALINLLSLCGTPEQFANYQPKP